MQQNQYQFLPSSGSGRHSEQGSPMTENAVNSMLSPHPDAEHRRTLNPERHENTRRRSVRDWGENPGMFSASSGARSHTAAPGGSGVLTFWSAIAVAGRGSALDGNRESGREHRPVHPFREAKYDQRRR
jgi:hypothetical protein